MNIVDRFRAAHARARAWKDNKAAVIGLTPLMLREDRLQYGTVETFEWACQESFQPQQLHFDRRCAECMRVRSFKIAGREQLRSADGASVLASTFAHVDLRLDPIRPGDKIALTLKNISGGQVSVNVMLLGTPIP